jgi:cobalt/nickel transport system ATP-binding protein
MDCESPAHPAPQASSLLRFEAVHYAYPGAPAPALAGISLEIPFGRRCGLIGENGSGKTTLFLLANGLLKPQRGCVCWRDRPLSYQRRALQRLRQQVGLVFQNPEHQLVATTVAEDLSFGLLNLGLDPAEARERIQQAAEAFGLADLLDRPVRMLSLGQKKMLSLADVMVLEPDLLLLDEPTAFLSPGSSRDLLQQLQRIHASGVTTVVASHDMDFLHRWADWLFVIDRGQLVLQGEPAQVFSRQGDLEALGLGVPPTLENLQRTDTPKLR